MACSRKIGPFDCCSVVQGDCLEFVASLPPDLSIVSDPPYGINLKPDWSKCSNEYVPVYGDSTPFNPWPWVGFRRVVLFGGNHYAHKLPPSPTWLVWDKKCGISGPTDTADCEFAWVKDAGPARVFRHYWNGFGRDSEQGDKRYHPTQKPIALMDWVIRGYCKEDDIIVDPYCGSGSTLVAAKKLGRHFLGFEISAEYCQIARERLARIEAQPNLFQPKAEQLAFA